MHYLIAFLSGVCGVAVALWIVAATIGAFAGVVVKTALWVIAP